MESTIIPLLIFLVTIELHIVSSNNSECPVKDLSTEKLNQFMKEIVPELLHGKTKGEDGKICVIGGSIEYTGAPYFAAISALKVGADLVYVVTTKEAAPVIKSYSPDLIVYPFLNIQTDDEITSILPKMDVVVIGPGLGRSDDSVKMTENIIKTCRSLGKPLVIDADGLFVVSKNPSILKDYPSPGVIMTPNHREVNKLKESVSRNESEWYDYWGKYVSVLIKGAEDQYRSSVPSHNWSVSEGGSGRRAGGQGDILSGSLGTFFSWALKNNKHCEKNSHTELAHSIASYAASKLTRLLNYKAFKLYGRSMTASDMLGQIHSAFEEKFEN